MKSLRQIISRYFCGGKDEPEKPFTTLRHRSRPHLLLTLRRQFPNANLHIVDSDYSAPKLSEFSRWLAKDQIDTRAYHPEWHDDDFARAVRCKMFRIGQGYKTTMTVAYCQGCAEGTHHAYNLLVTDDDKVYIIEPQTDCCVLASESKYSTDFIQL